MKKTSFLRSLGLTLLTGALALGTASPSRASTYGAPWGHRTILVYIDYNVSPRWYVTEDMAVWSALPGITVTRTRDPKLANIRVHQKDLPSPTAGQTVIVFSGGYIVGADVTLDSTALSRAYCSRRHIATHELGHALGLAHNGTSPTSLMFDGANGTCSTVPNAYDKADIKALYP